MAISIQLKRNERFPEARLLDGLRNDWGNMRGLA